MKYRVNFTKYCSVYVEAKEFDEAHRLAEFYLEQFPERYDAETWFPHSIQKVSCQKAEEPVYIEG